MHYRNGREAKNGDKVVKLSLNYGSEGEIVAFGILHSAVAGNDFCNGNIAPIPMQEHQHSRRMSPEVTNHPRIVCWKFDKDGPGVAMSYLTHPA